jgi:hypothetical protein
VDVTMLLCDAAQESGGKLFILGGGWSIIRAPHVPVPMSLALRISVPWDEANRKHNVRVDLLDDDGAPVVPEGAPGAVSADGQFEVGRPTGMKPGTPIDAPLVMNFGFLALEAGGYVWALKIDDKPVARAAFRVLK